MRSDARAESRSAWSRAARSATGSGSATPSARFSSTAHRAASGVRSSWLTLATSSRRCRSTVARSSAIRLKARASWPTSSLEVATTRPEWSPRAIRRAAVVISRSGEVMPTASSWVTPRASATVTGTLSQNGTPPAAPVAATTAATVTLTATSTPSFTLTEVSWSSSRWLTARPVRRHRPPARTRPRGRCAPGRRRSWPAAPSRGCRRCGCPRRSPSPTPRRTGARG